MILVISLMTISVSNKIFVLCPSDVLMSSDWAMTVILSNVMIKYWSLELNDCARKFNDYLVLVTDSNNFTRFSSENTRNGERSF